MDVREPIHEAARAVFVRRGYAGTTMQAVAVAAGVAPGVVKSLYENKEQLFHAAMRAPFDPANAVPSLIAPGLDGLGERIVRMTLTMMSEDRVRTDMTQVANDSGNFERMMRQLAGLLQLPVIDTVVSALGIPDARMRGTLIAAQLAGLAGTRYVLKLEPLASASDDQVVALYGPIIQALLDPTVPLPGSAARGQ